MGTKPCFEGNGWNVSHSRRRLEGIGEGIKDEEPSTAAADVEWTYERAIDYFSLFSNQHGSLDDFKEWMTTTKIRHDEFYYTQGMFNYLFDLIETNLSQRVGAEHGATAKVDKV